MLKKLIVSGLVLALAAIVSPALAGKSSDLTSQNDSDLPEQEGVYDVAGHKNLKLRVFVYHGKPTEKPGKPTPPPPQEICGLTDPESSSVVSPAGWVLPTAWEYNLNLNGVPANVGAQNLAVIARNSFNQWLAQIGTGTVAVLNGEAALTDRAQRDGQNIIAWGRTSVSALAVSYIWYRTDTIPYTAVEVDTIMNKKYSWAWSNPATWNGDICAYTGVYDAQNILTHELGHTFGLDDEYESAYQNNTMYGYGSVSETKKNTLTQGDKTGVVNLYK